MNHANRILLFALVYIFLFTAQAVAVTTINSLPYTCNTAGEVYVLGSNLTINSGTGITVSANNVTINGNNKVLTHSVTGAGTGININSVSGTEIYDLTINQGGYTGSGTVRGIGGSGSNLNIRNCTINVVARQNVQYTYGINVNLSSAGDIQYCTFNLSGVNRFYGFRGSGPWKIHHNTVTVSNHTYPTEGSYPFVFYLYGSNQQYYDNTITVGSDSWEVNVFAAWGAAFDNNKIYNNTIHFNAVGGRVVLMDSGTDNWEIYGNTITSNSTNTSSHPVFIFRVRTSNSGDPASTGHIIHDNIVDATNSQNVSGLVIGDLPPKSSGVRFYNNDIKTSGNPVYLYVSANVHDLDVYCNTIEYTGGGWNGIPVRIGSTTANATDIHFSNNTITGNQADGDLLEVRRDLRSEVTFCKSSVTSTAVIRGGGLVTIDTSGPCQNECGATQPPIQIPRAFQLAPE